MSGCHGTPSLGWWKASVVGECAYCGDRTPARPDPVGGKPACWPCWAQITFGEEDATSDHLWLTVGRCGACGERQNPTPDDGYEPEPPGLLDETAAEPCPVCGEQGACGYDDLGRALIHPIPADDEAVGT